MTPGLQFYAEQVDLLEGGPKRNELYVVCKDGSIQSAHEPGRPVGWELIEDGDDWYYRVTQNHRRNRCAVRYHSRTDTPPDGNGQIGYMDRQDSPQFAEITEQKDTGDEVHSKLAKIATIDPLLAQCAVILNDPVQTDAMAKFAEGKMSYSEMRGLCG
jgi:hypothetical protein